MTLLTSLLMFVQSKEKSVSGRDSLDKRGLPSRLIDATEIVAILATSLCDRYQDFFSSALADLVLLIHETPTAIEQVNDFLMQELPSIPETYFRVSAPEYMARRALIFDALLPFQSLATKPVH